MPSKRPEEPQNCREAERFRRSFFLVFSLRDATQDLVEPEARIANHVLDGRASARHGCEIAIPLRRVLGAHTRLPAHCDLGALECSGLLES